MHKIELIPIDEIKPSPRNVRKHPDKQIKAIARSIEAFGFNVPILIDADNTVLAGHGRLEAAKLLGFTPVPCFRLDHMTPAQGRAFMLADNRMSEGSSWDEELLAEELRDLFSLPEMEFEAEATGFSFPEIDDRIEELTPEALDDPEDDLAPQAAPQRAAAGDIWQIGPHRLACGSVLDPAVLTMVLAGRTVRLVLTDPPFNVPIDGHVSGGGKTRHREFAMAAGEMSRPEFTGFLQTALQNMVQHCYAGAILMVFMDWRHMVDLQLAGEAVGLTLKNLCVWAKTNGGMGSFYRSRHELVLIFKSGTAPHVNNFGLGEGGHYRTNVWEYGGATALTPEGRADLAAHPTVKPVRMLADAIRDVTGRGDVVLDGFAGSGSTLVAAEKTGRVAVLVELDPLYCDVILVRAERATKEDAVQVLCGWPRSIEVKGQPK